MKQDLENYNLPRSNFKYLIEGMHSWLPSGYQIKSYSNKALMISLGLKYNF